MKCKIMITISILLLIIIIITGIRMFALPTSKYQIIKKFEQNKELFEKSIEELSSEECISFKRDNDTILIYIYEESEDKVNIINVKEEKFYKYEQTIHLMNFLKIKHIYKSNGNTDFIFNSSLYPGGKSIVYITDLKHYISIGNKIREKQQILGNWHYVVTMSL